jgi:hypothetical protein
MGRTRSPWVYAVRCGLIAFGVASFVPVWTAWAIGSWEATGEPATFWGVVYSAVRADPGTWLDWFAPQFGAMVSVFCVGFWVGRFVAWRKGIGRGSAE